MDWARALAATIVLAAAGCRVFVPGLPAVEDGSPTDLPSAVPAESTAGGPDAARSADAATADQRRVEPAPPGSPQEMGCADGTREGFATVSDWPQIAGCAGAWTFPGLLAEPARMPRCGRQAGNDGLNPRGEGCSVTDLCHEGWHVCRDASEVARQSRSGCESAVPAGARRFFLVVSGASPQGICTPDRAAMNDLHGCGDLGQPQSAACEPLNRRMTFADCEASGVWACGSAGDHLSEAALVTKGDGAFGGVLCCRDN
jgi:hypothetical protein